MRLINLKYLATQLSCKSPVYLQAAGLYPQWTRARFVCSGWQRIDELVALQSWEEDRVGCGVVWCAGGRGTTIASHVFINFIELNRSPRPGNSRNMRPKTYKTAPCLRQAGRQAGSRAGRQEWGRSEGGRRQRGSLFGDLRLFDYFIFCRRLYMALN